jgi:hypothetical protein
MQIVRTTPPGRASALAGALAGIAAGLAAIALTGTAGARQVDEGALEPFLEASHLPPLLTARDEPVALRYDVLCTPTSLDRVDEPCDAVGMVHVRAGAARSFRELPLVRDHSGSSTLVASVPDAIARSPHGFFYYAVLHSERAGRTVVLPAGGAAAPQHSVPLGRPTVVRLGRHAFGHARAPAARVAAATWGGGPGQAGLEPGRPDMPIGAASFDVDDQGTVHLLDEANRRVLRWRAGAALPDHVPLAIDGTIADLALAPDGSFAVLETASFAGARAHVRLFDGQGVGHGDFETAERAVAIRPGPAGPVVLQHPSGQWMAVTERGRALAPSEQRRSGRAGRPLRRGGEVVVLRQGTELRLSLASKSGARRTWLLVSETPLAEVQLAEPLGARLLVVVRAYEDERAEFLVLLLDAAGVVERFAVPAADWVETAPLSRFRLAGSSLYQLGSTPVGPFVDRFDLEVTR